MPWKRSLALLVVIGLSTLLVASTSSTDDDEPMEKAMNTIKRTTRMLRKSLDDPKHHEDLMAQLGSAQAATIECRKYEPETAEGMGGEAKAKFIRDYRLELIGLQVHLSAIEKAILEGDGEAAKKLSAELKGMEKAGHKRFRKEEDH